MLALVLTEILHRYDIWITRRRKGDLVAKRHRGISRFIMWYMVSATVVMILFQPSFTTTKEEYNLIEKDGKYIHHNIGSSSDASVIDVLNVSDKDSYIENTNFVWVNDNGTEKKLPIESYDLVVDKNAEPTISYIQCKYKDTSFAEKLLSFPSSFYLKDFTKEMKITIPEEEE